MTTSTDNRATDPHPDDTPSVPVGVSFEIEVPGTPEQVWAALATAEGLSSWFLPTDVEERLGGALVTHMGETDSPATITAWEPPYRLVYEEPEWATLVGREGAPVTPLASEFVVEAKSGGTCVVRVVTSAFGTGADWENEFMTEMLSGWMPFFENLRLYLAHFPGQNATSMELSTTVSASSDDAWARVRSAVGDVPVGGTISVRGLSGPVHQAQQGGLLARVDGAASGLLGLHSFGTGPDASMVVLRTWLFSEGAADYIEQERAAWQAWLDDLASVPA
ncbi:MAG TPA: SRPBCC domain-containing protein [Mycobacteriales bacterium]|jgi:uncharacterized protein YndB with AHSA1/START domain|nr:SRPBCC domain-containing protein [Mycobacteriales bacterium]